MRLTTILTMTVGVAMTAQAGQRVTVYVHDDARVPQGVVIQAEQQAAAMFAFTGVSIDFRSGEPRSTARQALAIKITTKTPKTERPDALAYAEPLEGVHIVVFWDRIEYGISPAKLLAHVMVHEITHILEGTCRHSETGIMKAHWTDRDHMGMLTRPLPFADEDIELIHRGLAVRSATLTAASLREGR